MNFDYAERLNPYLLALDFDKAIDLAEAVLTKLPDSPFHAIKGASLLRNIPDLVTWMDAFYQETTKALRPKALYFTLTEFDINTDVWGISGFAYEQDGGAGKTDMDESMQCNGWVITSYQH